MNIVYSIGGVTIGNRVQFLKEGGTFSSAAFKCEYGSGGVRIEDPSGNLDIPGWQTFWVDDLHATPTRVWTGYIYDKTLSRGELPEVGVNRVHDCDIIDGNAALQFQVLHSNDAKRPDETDVDQVNWLMTSEAITGYGSLLVQDLGLISASDPLALLAKDWRGSFANAVLRNACDLAQKNAFGYYDTATGLAGMFYDKDEAAVFSSTIRISNVPLDGDGVTTFYPDSDAQLHQSGAERYGGVLFQWQGEAIYAQSASTITAMDIVRDAVVSDDKQIGDAATAQAEALSFLNTHAGEARTITVTILMPSASVNLLYAGMRMEVKFTHLTGFESFTWTRVRRRSVKPVGGEEDEVLWQVDLELWVPPEPVDDAEVTTPECDETGTIVQETSNDFLGNFVTFGGATVAGKVLLLFETKRDAPCDADDPGLSTTWAALSDDVSTNGLSGGDHGRWWYAEADGTDTFEVGACRAYVYETDIDFAGFGPGDVTDYNTDNGVPSSALYLGPVTAPTSGQIILYGAVYDTAFTGSWPATAGAGWSLDYNSNWYSSPPTGVSDQHPHTAVMHWDGTTTPLAGSASIGTSQPYAGAMIQVLAGCEDAVPLPEVEDPVGPEVPTGAINNSNTEFETAGPWLPGTLRVIHDGMDQTSHITTSDPIAGTYELDYAPAYGSTLEEFYESA